MLVVQSTDHLRKKMKTIAPQRFSQENAMFNIETKSGKSTLTHTIEQLFCFFCYQFHFVIVIALSNQTWKTNKSNLPFSVVSPRLDLKDLHAPILPLAPYKHHRNPNRSRSVPTFFDNRLNWSIYIFKLGSWLSNAKPKKKQTGRSFEVLRYIWHLNSIQSDSQIKFDCILNGFEAKNQHLEKRRNLELMHHFRFFSNSNFSLQN